MRRSQSELSPLSSTHWAPECSCSFLTQPWLSLQMEGLGQGPGGRAWGFLVRRGPWVMQEVAAMGLAEAPLHLARLSIACSLP